MSNSPSAYVGLSVTHRRYVTHGDAHYGGNLVNGAFVLELFGDVGTEASIRMDGDEGLLASYSDVQFRAPVLAGDIIEVTATVTAVGQAQQAARVRGAGSLPGRSVARGFGRLGAQRAYRRRRRHRDRGGAPGRIAPPAELATMIPLQQTRISRYDIYVRRWWRPCSASSTRPS